MAAVSKIKAEHLAKSRLAKLLTVLRLRCKNIHERIHNIKPQLQNTYNSVLATELHCLREENKVLVHSIQQTRVALWFLNRQ